MKRYRSRLPLPVLFILVSFTATQSPTEPRQIALDYIDTHNHFVFEPESPCTFDAAILEALSVMETYGIQRTLMMPQPAPSLLSECGYEVYAEIASRYPEQFSFLAGGSSLNPLIQQAIRLGEVTTAIEGQFQDTALAILESGALGFGEMAAEHFSMETWHPYETAPPDHELFLLLADIAASHKVPIDLHMEAIAEDILFSEIDPNSIALLSENNPDSLTENISGFERLLDRDPEAKIVWVHAGWDNTGHRTVALMQGLLERHENLYIQIRVLPHGMPLSNRPTTAAREVDSDWLTMLEAYPERFVIGLDSFYENLDTAKFQQPTTDFLSWLPESLARQIAIDNPNRIYNLSTSHITKWNKR